MKTKIYEDSDIIVYAKLREMQAGQEADIADAVLKCAFEGYNAFAGHLQDPQKFYSQVHANVEKKMEWLKYGNGK